MGTNYRSKYTLFTKIEKKTVSILYKDILLIIEMFCEKEQLLKQFESIFLSDIKDEKKRKDLFEIHQKQRLLMELLYMYGYIFFSRVCGIIKNKTSKKENNQFSLVGFLKNNNFPIDDELKRKVYCFAIYRHKLIEHHDFKRVKAFFPGDNFKIIPFGYNKTTSQELEKLAEKYGFKKEMIPTDLFYKIPLKNKEDRRKIDKIIEKQGCFSFSFQEIRQLFKDFMEEVKKRYY